MVGRGQRLSNIPSALGGGVNGVMGVDGKDTLWLPVVAGLEVSDIAALRWLVAITCCPRAVVSLPIYWSRRLGNVPTLVPLHASSVVL